MDMPELDLDCARLLVALQDRGSIGAAAREVGVSQPAASKRIREFEARWRLELVSRSARGSELTDDGEAVVAWARRVLLEVDVMRAGLAALTTERGAELTVAASLTVAEFMLPLWMAELRMREPDVHPQLRVVNSEQVAMMVRAGEVDVGFIETAQVPRDLHVTALGRDRLAIVVPPDQPWARRSTPLSHAALLNMEYVLREPGSGTRDTFERALRAVPRVAFEAGSTAALVGATLAGLGPAVVSARAVSTYLDTGMLVEVRHALDLWRPISAVRLPQRRFVAQAEELVRIAQAAVRRETGRSEPRRH